MTPTRWPGSSGRVLRELLVQLEPLLRAGMPVAESLASIDRPRAVSRVASSLHDRVRAGSTLADACRTESACGAAHAAWLRAGEESGRLPETLADILRDLDEGAAARSLLLRQALYPVVVLLVALVAAPVALWSVSGEPPAGLGTHVVMLLVVGAFGLTVALGPRWLPSDGGPRRLFERVAFSSPFVGTALVERVWGRLLSLSGRLIDAGVGLDRSLELVEDVTGWDRVRDDVRSWRRAIQEGSTVGDAFPRLTTAPSRVEGRLRSAERAGALDRALIEAGRDLTARYTQKMEVGLRVVPVVLYLLAALTVLRMGLGVFHRGDFP